MIGEKVERIADVIKNLNIVENKELLKMLNLIKEKYETSFEVFIKGDYKKSLVAFNGSEKQALEKLENQFIKSKNTIALSELLKLKKLFEYSKEIASLTR